MGSSPVAVVSLEVSLKTQGMKDPVNQILYVWCFKFNVTDNAAWPDQNNIPFYEGYFSKYFSF